MTDYADLVKRLREPIDTDDDGPHFDSVRLDAAAAISDLTKKVEEARAPKAAWNAAIAELAQMPECTAEALNKMRCLYTFIFDAVPEFTFEEEISDIVVRYRTDGRPMSFSFHFAKGMKAFPIWSDPKGLSELLQQEQSQRVPEASAKAEE